MKNCVFLWPNVEIYSPYALFNFLSLRCLARRIKRTDTESINRMEIPAHKLIIDVLVKAIMKAVKKEIPVKIYLYDSSTILVSSFVLPSISSYSSDISSMTSFMKSINI